MKIDAEFVRKIAMDMMSDSNPWEYGNHEDVGYIKLMMYYQGILALADAIITVIQKAGEK